jgi:PKD repeat protein
MLTYPFKSGELTELNLRVQNVSPNNPPLPEFVANTTSGVTPLSVKFTDTSLNGPTSWFWTFGDGNTSTLQNPVYIYLTAGVYTVNLTASNSAGTASIAKNNYISAVQSAPVAEFEANITQGMAPLVVGFTDKSSNIPTSWFWTFGDGNTSAERDPVHTYTTEGSYTVTLNVTNAGGFDTEIKENYIHVNPIVGGDKGYFSIHSNVDGANVFFDSDLKGTTASGVLVVPVYLTAPHYMNYTVTKAGYYPVTANLPGYPAKDQTVDINVNLVAIPPADVYYINATAMPGGQITPSQLVAVNTGQSQSFNINASSGYEITNILVDEQWMGKLSSYTFSNVTSNHTIVAYFTAGSSGPISGGGGGGGGGGGSFSVTTTTSPTTIPTTVGANVTPTGDGGDATGRGVTIAETGQITETPTPITTDTAAPPTTVSPAQPFWSKFPMVWLIPIILAIFIMAALAYYYYQRDRGEEFFEEK